MATKRVTIDLDAYELLRREKRERETYSDAIRRLARRRPSITEFAGIWKSIPAKDLERIQAFIREGRRLDRERLEGLLRRWERDQKGGSETRR